MLVMNSRVILMDVNMPTMDGSDRLADPRAQEDRAHTDHLITAHADEMRCAVARSHRLLFFTPIVPEVLRTKGQGLCRPTPYLMALQIRAPDRNENTCLCARAAARVAAEWKPAGACAEADDRRDEFSPASLARSRNPMSAIRNAVELMKVRKLLEKTAFARDVIDRQSSLLSHLVDDLLDISRITRGKIELRRQKFDLAQAIHSAVETNRALIEARRHSLEVSVREDEFILDGDFARTVQIVANLVHNAAKYTAGGGTIVIEVSHESGAAVIRVRDSGIGLPANKLADIFQPFVQLERGADGLRVGGLGVGSPWQRHPSWNSMAGRSRRDERRAGPR